MISRTRMKIDLSGQLLILTLGLLSLFIIDWLLFSDIALVLLMIWQIGSAIQLYLDYNYTQRGWFAKLAVVFCLSIPLLIYLPSIWSYLPFLILAACYLWLTGYDTFRVYRRHRSFWDLGA